MSKTETKAASVKDEVLEMAAKIEAGITMDAKTGEGKEDGLYETTLPEHLTMETIKAVSDHNTTFIAAGAYAFGKLAIDAMKDNKDLPSANLEVKMGGRDTVSYNVDRSKEFSNHLGDGVATIKHAVVTTSYDVRAGKNGGQLKAARQAIGEMGMNALRIK